LIIYGEYLFLENFITGVIILFFTGKILGEKVKPIPVIIGGILCGAYAFILFTTIHGILSLTGKVLFSMMVVLIVFGWKSKKQLLSSAMIFLGITISYGGIAIAILTSFGWTGVTAAAGVYLPPVTYIRVTAAAAAAALFLWFLLTLIKAKRMRDRTTVEAEVTMGTGKWRLKGFIDSGNGLKDPVTGRPVCIVARSLVEIFLKEVEQPETRYTLIPYKAVGVKKGILEGYRADTLMVGEQCIGGVVLAVCEDQDLFTVENDLQILLPASLLERGIYGDFVSN